MQPKSQEFLLDMRYFCNFSLASLGIRPRSRRGADRIRQGVGRLSRPPKTAFERSYLTENSSSANRILRPRRKKSPDRTPEKKNDRIYIYIFIFMCFDRDLPHVCSSFIFILMGSAINVKSMGGTCREKIISFRPMARLSSHVAVLAMCWRRRSP